MMRSPDDLELPLNKKVPTDHLEHRLQELVERLQ
jgi:hypothetical protein